MVKHGYTRVCIVLDPDDQEYLDYLMIKMGLKKTDVYRLALRTLYRKERREED